LNFLADALSPSFGFCGACYEATLVSLFPGGCFAAADSLFPSLVHAAESVLALYLVDAFAAVAAGSLGG